MSEKSIAGGNHLPSEYDGSQSTSAKLAREANLLVQGIGGAFVRTALHPQEKAPEVMTSAGFGIGLKLLSEAGAPGKLLAGGIALGTGVKMIYDEVTGNRWSTFARALGDTWKTDRNVAENIDATSQSVGQLAVDFTIGSLTYKAMGLNSSNERQTPNRLSGRPALALAGETVSTRHPRLSLLEGMLPRPSSATASWRDGSTAARLLERGSSTVTLEAAEAKMVSPAVTRPEVLPGLNFVSIDKGHPLSLGAGGSKFYYLVGAIRALERLKIPIGTVTGTSAGGDAAAAVTNGMTSRALLSLALNKRARMFDPQTYMQSFNLPTPDNPVPRAMFSLKNLWEQDVQKLGWKPNERLQLVSSYKAASTDSYQPYLFRGTNYKLGPALAATGGYEPVFSGVRLAETQLDAKGGMTGLHAELPGDTILEDGGKFHLNPIFPTAAAKPEIVIRLNRVKEIPDRLEFPHILFNPIGENGLPAFMERQMYWNEMHPGKPVQNAVDASKNVLIDIETDVPAMNFFVSKQKALSMVRSGYRQASNQLKDAIASGKLESLGRDFKPRRAAGQ